MNKIFCKIKNFQVLAMVQARDRRVELGYKLALECNKQVKN